MYNKTSEQFNNLVMKSGRTFRARILIGDIVLEGLSNLGIVTGSNDGDAITIGSTIAQTIDVTMDTPNIALNEKEFELQIGMMLADETVEYLPIGLFTPEKVTDKSGKTTFTAYDRMIKLSGSYVSDLTDETDTLSVLNEISEKTGVPIDVTGLASIGMKKLVGYTYRNALAIVSQLYGCFANVNREGTIEFHFWEDSGYVLTADQGINGFSSTNKYTVEKLSCIYSRDSEGNAFSIIAGDGEKGISISNAFMTQDVLNAVYEKIGGFSYDAVECPVILGDPRLDPWDLITIVNAKNESYKVPLMSLNFTYDGGLSCVIKSTIADESEERDGYKSPMVQLQEKVDGLKTTLVSFSQTINDMQVGGRNLIRNSETLQFEDYYFVKKAAVLYSSDGYPLIDANGIILYAFL